MAIKIQGTTVINDSRDIENIGTVTANTFVGDGSQLTGIAAGGGSGLFNTAISGGAGYTLTDSMATAYTAPATADFRYIVHSIHITNYGSAEALVTGQFSGTNYSSISFATNIPVPVESSVELLKKPKVLQPSDLIQLQSSAASTLSSTITIESVSGTELFGKGLDLTTSNTYADLHTATANSVVESILLSNDDAGELDVKATVVWTDGADAIQSYLSSSLIVPNDATIEILEQPKYLPSGHKIRVLANQANRLEANIAGKVIA